MQHRPIGESGIEASVIGLGTWAIGGWMWGGTNEAEAVRAIHAALDAGINLIDTAPAYGFGLAEEIVGRALRGRRHQAVLATKCGLVWHTTQGVHFFDSDESQPGERGSIHVYRCLAPRVIRYEIEASLKRLQTDVIDLYQTHWQDTTTPIAESMAELMKLKQEGKIRAIGCSNATPAEMDAYRAAGSLDLDQELYSMLDRTQESANLPYCDRQGVAFLAYSPLAQGLLTGAIGPDRIFAEGDQRRGKPRFSVENRAKVAALLEVFRPIAVAHGVSLGQLALAWTSSQPGCTHVLAGARDAAQAAENAAAGRIALTAAECQTMRQAIVAHAATIP